MADVVTRLVVESKEYDSKIARATSGLTQFEKKCREVGGTLEFVEKEDLDFVKALGQMDTVASSATGKLGELKKAFTELSVQYKNLTDAEKQSPYGQALAGSLDVLKDRIGDLKGQLDSVNSELNGTAAALDGTNESAGKSEANLGIMQKAFEQLSKSIGGVGPAASNMGKMLTGALGPVGIAIAAVVGVFKQLSDAYKRNEEAMSALQQVAAPFKALWDGLQRLFDDLVKADLELYESLGKTSEGFSALDIVVKPVSAALGVVRGLVAVLSTLFIDMAKGIGILKDKMDAAFQGSKIQSFFQGIKDTVQGFFQSFVGWVEKIANSKLGQKLGLDSLYEQIKGIANSQDELTKSNQKIADTERQLKELRRTTKESNAVSSKNISEYRYKASDKQNYSASERVGLLEKAMKEEENILKRNLALRKKEYELIKLKNSLTQSGTEDLDAQADAFAAMQQAEQQYNEGMRSLQRQIQGAKNEASGAANGTVSASAEEQGPAEGSIAWQEKEVARLTELWKNATGDGVEQYKTQLDEAKKVLEEMMGKTQDATTAETGATFNGPSMSAFEELQQSIRIKLADQNFEVDQNSLTNLMTVAIQNGIDGLNGAFEGLQYQLAEGLDIPDSAWQALADQINEQLANLGLDPIKLDVTTGGVQQAEQAAKGTADAWQNAVAAVNNVGNALQQLEDPAAKVSGIVMQAVANIALGFAQAAASPATGAAGVFGWIAAATAGVATMVSTIAAIKSATSGGFANGGIVPGNSFSGDNLRTSDYGINAGELILNRAQQGSIASQLQGTAQQTVMVEGRISGKDILLSANNTNRAAGGSRGYYTKVK